MKCERCGFEIPARLAHQNAQNCLDYLRVRYEALRDKSRRQAISAQSTTARVDRYREQAKLANSLLRVEQRKVKRLEEKLVQSDRVSRTHLGYIREQAARVADLERQLGRIGQIAGRSAA